MRKFIIVFSIFCGFIYADVLPYKPKPIIWVHGLGGSSVDWGAGVYKIGNVKTDSIHPDSVIPGSSYSHFLNDFMVPIVEVWDEIDPSYTTPEDPPPPQEPGVYPNKTFLEVINFDYNTGSVNAEAGWAVPFPPYVDQIGQEAEIRQRIKEVLEEYYGPNWQNDTSAKVILVCHSMGSPVSRYSVSQDATLASHIAEIVTIGGVHKPVTFMDTPEGELWFISILYWLPIEWLIDKLTPDKWFATLGEIKMVLTTLGLETIGSAVFSYCRNKYTDAGYDLGHTEVFSYLNSESALQKQRSVVLKVIASKNVWSWAQGFAYIVAVAQAPYLIGQYGPIMGGIMAAAKVASAYAFDDHLSNSDFAVPVSTQRAEDLGLVESGDIIEVEGFMHGDEPKQWNLFRDAIEPPVWVSIDSAIVFKDGNRTAYALPNENNVIETAGDSLFLKGRTNVYFLANADAKVSLNGSGWISMQWPSALGREGQGFFYKIPQEYLFVPENYIAFSLSREIEKVIFVFFSDIDMLNWRNIMIHLEVYDANT